MLPFRVFARLHPRFDPPAGLPRRAKLISLAGVSSTKSLALNLFADPHPLNLNCVNLLQKPGGPGSPIPNSSLHSSHFLSYPCALFGSFLHFLALSKKTIPFVSSSSALFAQKGGVGRRRPDLVPRLRASVAIDASPLAPPVPLRHKAFGATICKGARFLQDPGKQVRSARCLRVVSGHRELFFGVPGSSRLGRDRKSCLGTTF